MRKIPKRYRSEQQLESDKNFKHAIYICVGFIALMGLGIIFAERF